MGNACCKQEPEAFSTPGRRLGDAPTPATTASVPAQVQPRGPQYQEQRRLGGGAGGGGGGGSAEDGPTDAAARAAAAAEARAQGSGRKPQGKLGAQLAAQKKQTQNETLQQASNEERRLRELDANAQALSHE